ncbi:hypothetical protein KR222_007200, partial [Zaprionus bogoriensis]
EFNLLRADEELRAGRREHSIYYQVRALFQCADMRLLTEAQQLEQLQPQTQHLLAAASDKEKQDYKSNTFLSNILKHQRRLEQRQAQQEHPPPDPLDFLHDVQQPECGFERIAQVCEQLPPQWCVLQLCKSFNPATTYSTYCDIAAARGDIYVALLRHCRTPELPPTCVHISHEALGDIFREYSTLVERFRAVVTVDPLTVKTQEAKAKYWKELNAFGESLKKLIAELTTVMTPYCFLFLGKRYTTPESELLTQRVFRRVDELCTAHDWSSHQRTLLSQAALHANRLPRDEMKLLSYELGQQCRDETEALRVYELLKSCASDWQQLEHSDSFVVKRFPTILIRLDQMHWEQLAPMQECTRIKSLHSLWRLYKHHREQVRHGYYTVNIKRGMTLINPDADLANSGRRLRSFLEYWLSHWHHMFEKLPTEQTMTEQAFKADCFVYAGHGSTLQYVSSRVIYRNRIRGVVFLFGCDSTRVMSSGLYSALYGAQDYYHGALCPTVVGTLMPALDGNMDNVSAHVLSRWNAPAHQQVIPWTHIDRSAWVSQGVVKGTSSRLSPLGITSNSLSLSLALPTAADIPGGNIPTLQQLPGYQIGSLSSILACVQLGKVEPKIYNYCIYVCRGLPAWNLAVEKMPF